MTANEDGEQAMYRENHYTWDATLCTRAQAIRDAHPYAVDEIYRWYSGWYMGENAAPGGKLDKTLRAIADAYGKPDIVTGTPLFRTIWDEDQGLRAGDKPILSWSSSQAGAQHFYDYFVNGVNRQSSWKHGYRIITSALPSPIVTFDTTMAFLQEACGPMHTWLNVEEMQSSHEVLSLTPDPCADLRTVKAMPPVPLGPREERAYKEPGMAFIRDLLGLNEDIPLGA